MSRRGAPQAARQGSEAPRCGAAYVPVRMGDNPSSPQNGPNAAMMLRIGNIFWRHVEYARMCDEWLKLAIIMVFEAPSGAAKAPTFRR
jgi:hypothetical protein